MPPYTIHRHNIETRRELNWSEAMDLAWPEFMKHDPIALEYFPQLRNLFPETIFYICDKETIVVLGQSIPVFWDGEAKSLPDTAWDWALKTGIEAAKSGQITNTLCALEIAVSPPYRGQGLSKLALKTMRQIALEKGYRQLIAPVRPSQKHLYPLIPIKSYITWKREDGFLFDSWLRTHQRLGAKILKAAEKSMQIEGTIQDWESWTKTVFPGSGKYIVEGALVPVSIDYKSNTGVYVEPNVWMLHSLIT